MYVEYHKETVCDSIQYPYKHLHQTWKNLVFQSLVSGMNLLLGIKQQETSATKDHSTIVLNDQKLTSYLIISEKERAQFEIHS
jgi:hypothetical protein